MASNSGKNKAAQQDETPEPQETQAGQTIAKRRALDDIAAEVSGGSHYSREELQTIASFDDAILLAAREFGPIVYADQELGDGYALLADTQKKLLVGVPLLLQEWAFRDGDFGRPFVSVRLIARNPDGGFSKYIINDGSTGIAEQLADYQLSKGRTGGMLVGKGLRASTYEVEVNGELKTATTYYLDTAKA